MKVLISVLMVMAVMDSGLAQDNDSYLSALQNSQDVDTLQGSFILILNSSVVLTVIFGTINCSSVKFAECCVNR